MSEEKDNKTVHNLIEEKPKRHIKTQGIVGFKNNKAIEQSIKMIDISNKLAPQIPKTMLVNEQFNKILNINMPTINITTFMANYQSMLPKIKSTTGLDIISTKAGEFARQQLNICNENIMRGLANSMSDVISQIAEVQRQFINSIADI